MRTPDLLIVLASAASALLVAAIGATQAQSAQPADAVLAEMAQRTSLRPVSAFSTISDRNARSVALFEEAGKVITHPRCANCHPVSTPAQGDDRHPHSPPVTRGILGEHKEGKGPAGLP